MGLSGGKGLGVGDGMKKTEMSISPVCSTQASTGQIDWFRPEVGHAPQISHAAALPHHAANYCSAVGGSEWIG